MAIVTAITTVATVVTPTSDTDTHTHTHTPHPPTIVKTTVATTNIAPAIARAISIATIGLNVSYYLRLASSCPTCTLIGVPPTLW